MPSSYVVEAALSPGGAPIATLPVPGTTVTVPNVPNGVYYVRVRGLSDGTSEASNEVIVVVPGGGGGCSSPPNPPQNLTGSAIGSTVNLAWSPPVGGCAPSSYAVHAGSAPGLSNITVVNVGAVTSLTASAPSGTYYIRVVALNTFGGSAPSNEVAVTVTNAPPGCGPTMAACGEATARCNDGTYSCSQNRRGTCSSHGGVACWICPGRLCNGDVPDPMASIFRRGDDACTAP